MNNTLINNKRFPGTLSLLALSCLLASGTAQALTTFTASTPAQASQVNANFSELDDRLDAIEGLVGAAVVAQPVDCAADDNALNAALNTASPGSSFVISGTCIGPVYVRKDNISLVAATAGIDGITTPFGTATEVLAIIARNAYVKGLRLDGSNNAAIDAFVVVKGDAKVDDVTAVNATSQFWVGRGGVARFYNITDANIGAGDNGWARLYEGNNNISVGLSRSGGMEVRTSGINFTGITVQENSFFRLRPGNSMTLNGTLKMRQNSTADFAGPVTQFGGNIDIRRGNTVHFAANTSLSPGSIKVEDSNMFLEHGSEVITAGSFHVHAGGALKAYGYDENELPSAITITAQVNVSSNGVLDAFNVNFKAADDITGGIVSGGRSASIYLEQSTAGQISGGGGTSIVLSKDTQLTGNNGVALSLYGNSSATIGGGSNASSAESPDIFGDVQLSRNSSLLLDGYSSILGGVSVFTNSSVQLYGYASIAAPGADCAYNGTIHLHAGSILDLEGSASSVSGFLRYNNIGTATSRFEAYGQPASALNGLRAPDYLVTDLANSGTDTSNVTTVTCP